MILEYKYKAIIKFKLDLISWTQSSEGRLDKILGLKINF